MKLRFSLLTLLLFTTGAFAQKKPIDHSVYDSWSSIGAANLSPSGTYVYYTITPQEGNASFFLKDNKNKEIFRLARGANPQITKDESYLISLIKPSFEDTRAAKIKKKKADDMPKDSILVYAIQNGNEYRFPNVKSYQLPKERTSYLAFVSDVKSKPSQDTTQKKKEKEKIIPTLHLLHLATGDTTNFAGVDQYQINDAGTKLVFSTKVDEKDSLSTAFGVYLYDIQTKQISKITKAKGTYKGFQFDKEGSQVTYLGDLSKPKASVKMFSLYHFRPGQDTASVLVNSTNAGIPKNWLVSGDANLSFSDNGEKLFLGLAPTPRVKDTTLVDFEHAKLDIWSWTDDYLQPMQLANLKRDLSRSYTAVVYPGKGPTVIPLIDNTFSRITFSDSKNEEWALATSDFGRRIAYQWNTATQQDIYAISTINGQKKLVKKDLSGQAYLSPDGGHILYFDLDNSNWYSYDIATESTIQLNNGVPVNFADEDNDMPAKPSAYGIAGWSSDGKSVYIYDKYDMWNFSLNGEVKQLSTNGHGRATQTTFRYLDLSPAEDRRSTFIDPKKGYYLTAFAHKTKQNGVYKLSSKKNRNPDEVFMSPFTFKRFVASDDQKSVLYTKESYESSPNLYLATAFKTELRITDINAQQKEYNWGTAELVHWTTPNGSAAEGILYKPEDFDPNKKYPIIAYFYEKLSDGLYTYQAPAPTPSRLNISYFVSNGYLVFAPDIQYEIGYPGKSAEEYINSGMQYLAQNPWVDATKMGIQGQSWGGYQVAHLITKTNMYAAAWSGAPVVNMTSAYGGIRWQTGMSRQFQYENTQSRLGKTIWEDRGLYLENSPLFNMDKVTTPVVIMANDNDGAVPWYQGIEMFTALRRLQKPVWMLNYNGEEHNLMQRQNRKDIQIREAQFFDHYLKGKPAPNWMSKGIPATAKGIDWGFDFE
jgi:dipeptidyl aminopeptidase/acylaminoacyl peptidase